MITINKIESHVQSLLGRLNQIAEAIDYGPQNACRATHRVSDRGNRDGQFR